MNTELTIALISGAVAISAAMLAIWGQLRSTRLSAKLDELKHERLRKLERESALAHYREPLARAAYDLQSRLYNILQQNLIRFYYVNGDERERAYVVDNTAFLVAQYFAWIEIIRRDIQYINLGADDQTRQFARLQDNIYALFQTDEFGPIFRVFSGEQRAIGERMVLDTLRGPECLGYSTFIEQIAKGHSPLVELIREDVGSLGARLQEARPRLAALQNALIEILAFLDPEGIRFPEEKRTKVDDRVPPNHGNA